MGIPIPFNKPTSRLQFKPGVKCVFSKEGDQSGWKISTAYLDPKSFDFAGINRATIYDRFKVPDDQTENLTNYQRHRAIRTSDYNVFAWKLMMST